MTNIISGIILFKGRLLITFWLEVVNLKLFVLYLHYENNKLSQIKNSKTLCRQQ